MAVFAAHFCDIRAAKEVSSRHAFLLGQTPVVIPNPTEATTFGVEGGANLPIILLVCARKNDALSSQRRRVKLIEVVKESDGFIKHEVQILNIIMGMRDKAPIDVSRVAFELIQRAPEHWCRSSRYSDLYRPFP